MFPKKLFTTFLKLSKRLVNGNENYFELNHIPLVKLLATLFFDSI